jgi:hypothetical protein
MNSCSQEFVCVNLLAVYSWKRKLLWITTNVPVLTVVGVPGQLDSIIKVQD